jgi:DNA (cytosine-5)-methyltransferase 1
MNYISVCSGIEAVSVAWHDLFQPRALCEFEAFPSAVLAHHYPDVPNMGDLTKWREWPEDMLADADILVGGTPCQAFSVAGLRASLADDRGNLSLEFVRLANAIDDVRHAAGREPGIVLWENVPGVLSVRDNAFGCFLAALAGEDTPLVPTGGKWTDAGVVAGPKRTISWRILDAQYFGVAQRRRRVFVCGVAVGHPRAWAIATSLLPLAQGLRRDTPPRRETGQIAPTIPSRSTAGGGLGTDFDLDGGVIRQPVCMAHGQANAEIRTDGGAPTLSCIHEAPIIAGSLLSGGHTNNPLDETLVTHSLRTEGFDASEDGTGRGTPLVPVQAFYSTESRCDHFPPPDLSPPLKVGSNGGGQPPAIAFSAKDQGGDYVQQHMAVRRLTPVECERLQGFPDNYTNIPWRGKPEAPDGPRYKALGNSMAVPVMRWIGRRIAEALK